MSEIEIRKVSADEVVDLRHRILRAGLGRDAAIFTGDDDPGTLHLAAYDGEKIVGCATILVNSYEGQPACQLRGMAVDSAKQRSGIGTKLLDEVHKIAVETGVLLIWANARTPAAEFYRKHGWTIVSGEFEIPTAGPHFKMTRKL